MKPEFVQGLIDARRRMTPELWRTSACHLLGLSTLPGAPAIEHAISGISNADAAWALKTAIKADPTPPGMAIGAAMLTVDQMDFAEAQRTELIRPRQQAVSHPPDRSGPL